MVFCFFNDTATTEIYTLSLHDALPICVGEIKFCYLHVTRLQLQSYCLDRKSTRLNSSHANISYAVFCLKKNSSSGLTVRSGVDCLIAACAMRNEVEVIHLHRDCDILSRISLFFFLNTARPPGPSPLPHRGSLPI